MSRRLRGWLKLLLGLALAPAAAAMLVAAAKALTMLLQRPADTRYFLLGCAAYPVAHYATTGLGIDAPRRFLYVFAHELTHAIAAMASGYRIKSFVVGKDGGHVDMSDSNVFVALAPYVLPFYGLLVVVAYRVWLWKDPNAGILANEVFLLCLGAALAFHWVFTWTALWSVQQPDLALAGGTLFSLVLICLGNGAVVLVALKCLFPKLVSLDGAFRFVFDASMSVWTAPLRFR
ncbi:MAG: M50 family metallopeptidase [Elusimicrobia bacterium]|nr:M50 family metallopeptidase [Elusimicrobiota bacterium]